MTEAQLSLLADTRLSPRARIAGLYISQIEGGDEQPVEIPSTVFEALLGKSWDVLRADIRALETNGWIERDPNTGRGHSPAYRFLAYAKSPPYQELRVAFLRTLSVGLGESATLKPDSPPESATLNGRSSSSREVVGVVGERARGKAEEEILAGCRGALRDYLAGSVPEARQHAYVQTLIGWRNGIPPGVWRKPDGGSVAPEEQTALLAAALNELGASDESMMKRPVGDPANLKTKIGIILRQAHQPGADHRGNRNSEPRHTKTPAAGRASGSFLGG